MPVVFAVVNFKGGVGKTTVAVHLAHALALMGRKVLLIDTDAQCNTTKTFGVKYAYSLYDVFYGVLTLNEVIVSARPNLDLAPSDPKMQNAGEYIQTKPLREFVLRKNLESVKVNYDYVFIDNNPAFTVITQNAIAAADQLIIPVELEHYSMQGVVNMARELLQFCDAIDHKIDIGMVLPMKLDKRYRTTEHYMDGLKKHFRDRLYTPIRTDANVSNAPGFKKTIFEHNPRSKAAQDFVYVAERLDKEVQAKRG